MAKRPTSQKLERPKMTELQNPTTTQLRKPDRRDQMDRMVRNRNTMNQTPVGKTAGQAAGDTRSILENAFRKSRKK